MKENILQLKRSFWGHKYNYLYLIYRLNENRFLYIGQTEQRTGVIGRLCQHLQEYGTLIRRAEERGVNVFSGNIALEYFLLEGEAFKHKSY